MNKKKKKKYLKLLEINPKIKELVVKFKLKIEYEQKK